MTARPESSVASALVVSGPVPSVAARPSRPSLRFGVLSAQNPDNATLEHLTRGEARQEGQKAGRTAPDRKSGVEGRGGGAGGAGGGGGRGEWEDDRAEGVGSGGGGSSER